jgi:TonB-dependent SusC/RagA subfamily outer membrane receptor
VQIDGRIVDDMGNTITEFRSFRKGIGTFLLKPDMERKYFALVYRNDKEQKIPLPQPLKTGLVMNVTDHQDKALVRLRANWPPTADPTANEVILTGQIGGRFYYGNILRLENGEVVATIPKASFPAGIMQITVFSGRGVPLAERLVFVSHMNYMRIRFNPTDSLTDDGRKINLSITTTDLQGYPLPANLSLSITREIYPENRQNQENIISNLLLSSDLKGYVEDPLDYFTDQAPSTLTALDNLMLTQGWRRFNWNNLLEGEYPEILYHEEKGLTIFGRITRDFFNIPLKNCKVQLSVMDAYNDVFTQQSSGKGYFIFENLVYYDTISVKIEAWRPSGRRNLVIVLPDEKHTEVAGQQGNYQLTTLSERDNRAYRIEKSIEAREAYIEEQERLEEERKNSVPSLHGEPDNVLRSSDFPKGSRDIVEAMKGRVPGVTIMGDQIFIRGVNSFSASNQPLFLIDGVPTNDVGAVRAIPVEDIERVEILKGPSTAIYGVRGGNGVIAVYTKRGQFIKRGVIEFDMLGYSKPREFYQPKYLPDNEPADNYTLLWKPVIVTSRNGTARISFDKPRVKGDYRFTIQGISYGGHAGFVQSVINNG